MKRIVEIEGTEMELEFRRDGAAVNFRLGTGVEQAADVEQPEPGVYSVLLEGRSYEARVEPGATGYIVVIDGQRFETVVLDPRRWSRQSRAHLHEGLLTVTAPMPGKVVRMLVASGDEVESGQDLVVVEAMKMQNELKAVRSGRVVALQAREGDTVAAGDVLVTIE